jgi:hypothetical protein
VKRQERSWVWPVRGAKCESAKRALGVPTLLPAVENLDCELLSFSSFATTLYPDNPPVSDNQQSKWVTPQVSGTSKLSTCAPARRNRPPEGLRR